MIIIIDGNWYSEKKDTLGTRLWRRMSLPLIMISEKPSSVPRNYDEELLKNLPMINKDRPNYDLRLLELLGLNDIHINI